MELSGSSCQFHLRIDSKARGLNAISRTATRIIEWLQNETFTSLPTKVMSLAIIKKRLPVIAAQMATPQ